MNAGGPRPLGMSEELFKYVVFKDPEWDFRTLDVAKHLDMARTADGGTISATSPNIKSFVNRGGKLIIYHGWGDTNVPPGRRSTTTTSWWRRLARTRSRAPRASISCPAWGIAGAARGRTCSIWSPSSKSGGNGEGAGGRDRVTDRRREGRPHASAVPVPLVPRYKGAGSLDQAASFECR